MPVEVETSSRSYSPSAREIDSSVRLSAMPFRTRRVWNSDMNPSAAASPQRVRAWERSCRPTMTCRFCPPAWETSAGRSWIGAMFATSSSAHSIVGARSRWVWAASVDGVADLLEQADDQRCAERLVVLGRGDVDRVRRARERVRVEVRVGRGRSGRVGVVGGEDPCGGAEDARALAGVGALDPDEHARRRSWAPVSARISIAGARSWRSVQSSTSSIGLSVRCAA